MSSVATEYTAPFLYEALVSEALSSRGAKTLLLTGGSCTGKTTVLDRLCRKFGPSAIAVRGCMEKGVAIEAIRTAIAEDRPLFIDDVDDLFDVELAEALRDLEQPTRKQRTFVTSTLPPDLASLHADAAFSGVKWEPETLRAWSIVTMTFTTRTIDPWSAGWHRRVADHVMRITGETVASGWTTVVLHVTGGHPVMLDAGLQAIDAEKAKRGTETLDDRATAPAEWQRRVLQLEDEIFVTGFRRLRRGLLELERRDGDALEGLRAISRGELGNRTQSTAAKRSLFVSGLAYRTVTQPFVIAGETLRRYLAGDSETRQPSVDVVPGEGDRGDLIITIGNERRVVPLRAASWRLLKVLRETNSDFVTLQALHKKAGVESKAVRSALQRLKAEIHRGGFDEIVENVWGAGYRLGVFPLTVLAPATD